MNSQRLREASKKVTTPELVATLDCLRSLLVKACNSRIDFDDDNLDDEDYVSLTGITRDQFDNLMFQIKSLRKKKYSLRNSIGILLTKLRTGVSTPILKTMFKFKRSIHICHIISKARKAILKDFVPMSIGFDHVSRNDVKGSHTTIFARELLAGGNADRAILILDGTYIYIEKSSKYTFQRKSYSMYKGRPLVKPMVITASDGYIIDILGPFLADGKNNDAAILNSLLYNKESSLRKWLAQNDIFVVDRGFRDSVDLIESLGFQSESPAFLRRAKSSTRLKRPTCPDWSLK